MLRIELATTPDQIEQVRGLFRDYEAWLGYDLCFQGFEQELAGLPGRYASPDGRLFLATEAGRAVGCIALRSLGDGSCEMKRLYVRPSHRTRGLGRAMAERLIREAAEIGYERMRLDTLPVMGTARNLYVALGFREIPPYYSNPIQGAIYMELAIAPGRRPGSGTDARPGGAMPQFNARESFLQPSVVRGAPIDCHDHNGDFRNHAPGVRRGCGNRRPGGLYFMRFRPSGLLAAIALSFPTCAPRLSENRPPVWSAKLDIAAFERVENERLAGAQQSLDRLLAVEGARTVENTLVPYDDVSRQMNTAAYLANLVEQLHPDKSFRDSATAVKAKIDSAQNSLSLNPSVYRALASINVHGADSATRYYVQRELLEFRLNGVDKDERTRETLKKLRDQLALDQSMFQRNINDDEEVVQASPDELDGLPQDFTDRHKPEADGKVRIATRDPDASLVMTLANNDSLRRRVWDASQNRGYPKNREVLLRMLRTRYEIATLLGYASWADYLAADKMVGNGANVASFLDELHAASRSIAKREFALELAEKRKLHHGANGILSYEFFHLSELVRRAQYSFDSQSIRPYLPYPEVKQGVMSTAAKLFDVSFKQETSVPVWHSSVETWDVIDHGKAIGRFYLDMHPRQGKIVGGAMSPLLDGIRGKQLPEGVLECNFPEPTATDPGLMDCNDVVTFFHEFGHLMHHILGGQQQWAGLGATSVENDFVEAPSQMLEEWMLSPQVLASFARHYKTHQPIPADLVLHMRRALSFGAANLVEFQTALAAVSYGLHKQNPKNIDPDATMIESMRRFMLLTPVPSDAHRYASFRHLGSRSYSSAFYTYLWDRVIAEDFFEQFDQKNLLAGDAPARYRRTVLEPGGSMPARDLVRHFLGRPQNTTAFQHWMEREFEPVPNN